MKLNVKKLNIKKALLILFSSITVLSLWGCDTNLSNSNSNTTYDDILKYVYDETYSMTMDGEEIPMDERLYLDALDLMKYTGHVSTSQKRITLVSYKLDSLDDEYDFNENESVSDEDVKYTETTPDDWNTGYSSESHSTTRPAAQGHGR